MLVFTDGVAVVSAVCFQQKVSTTGEPPARSGAPPPAAAVAPSTSTATNRRTEPEKTSHRCRPLLRRRPARRQCPHVRGFAAVLDDSNTTLGGVVCRTLLAPDGRVLTEGSGSPIAVAPASHLTGTRSSRASTADTPSHPEPHNPAATVFLSGCEVCAWAIGYELIERTFDALVPRKPRIISSGCLLCGGPVFFNSRTRPITCLSIATSDRGRRAGLVAAVRGQGRVR